MALTTDLSGRVAIVTGSATGLGASIAKRLAEAGASVVINYSRSSTEAEQTADEIRALGAQVHCVQANVAEDADCKKLAQTANAYGRLDILVNNAGITKQVPDHSNLAGLDKDDFLRLYEVNVVGPFMMVRACEDLLRAAHSQTGIASAVLNTSSIAGVTGIGSSVAYAASKGAFNTMTLSLARALAPAIRVNAICPGFIGTRWFKDYMGEEKYNRMEASVRESTPLNVASGPDDIADSAMFFLTDASRHVTGETLLTDGGTHLGYAPLKAR
ncbi:SDR family NAD(P)-dependent oxidoreductase [Ponticaulis sp.]|uniref:SDR family NAD(P)-dependent oxidoreductase n=1 Tax=Ponticaulis sp. TaxID=2020902 RepID=UPI000B6817B5|nr:glucose 1-dehydrogenase [Ponticaulis sp.]MAI89764.1 oxidoreductase [Ponticaulis sp.]OUY00777.1 MAG: oxidoreductase [Hyphomonadaceae bacterium TMED5]|tara:strand:- start:23133 stop:23948 length:816 start_codon:yes stop_codon:yes gene_type:complete